MLDIVSGNANVAEAPLVDRSWRRMMAEGAEDATHSGPDDRTP